MKMTPEETFQVTVRGLAAQGWRRSMVASGDFCAYRGTDGRKCAVGHHIPDDRYCEGWDAAGGDGWRRLPKDAFGDAATDDFDAMQTAHDNGYRPETMRQNFIAIGGLRRYVWPADVPTEGEIT